MHGGTNWLRMEWFFVHRFSFIVFVPDFHCKFAGVLFLYFANLKSLIINLSSIAIFDSYEKIL
jgi:hypothetical protein